MKRIWPALVLGTFAAFAVVTQHLLGLGAAALLTWILLATATSLRASLKPLRKLTLFISIVTLSYGLLGGEAPMHKLPYVPIEVSQTGLVHGLAMGLRMLLMVLASAWVRAITRPGAFVDSLLGLGMPNTVALVMDGALALFESGEGGRGSGQGRGGGKGGGKGRKHKKTAPFTVRELLRGNVTILVSRIEANVARAQAHQSTQQTRDVAILVGILVFMLSLKALKILPGLPFAPGHKGVLLIPMYLLAVSMTRMRWAGTTLGVAFGTISFLFGDGRYGVFEILKHITPGFIADLLAPAYREKTRGLFFYAALGVIIAVGRFATIAVVLLFVDAPPEVFAYVAPLGTVHLVFGALSGAITRGLLSTYPRPPEKKV